MHRGNNVMYRSAPPEELHAHLPEPDPDYLNGEDDDTDFPSPPPPLTADDLSAAVSAAFDSHHPHPHHQPANGMSRSVDGALPGPSQLPPKPVQNPSALSKEKQELHRELLMNYKIGKDVLRKPELNKVLRERRETQKKKEWEVQKSARDRTSLDVKLQERANRMKEEEEHKQKIEEEEATAPELVRMHRKITLKSGSHPPVES